MSFKAGGRGDPKLTVDDTDSLGSSSSVAAQRSEGRRLGRFEDPRPIGRGGMGQVYRAYDPERQEEVAVKVLLGLDARSYARFRREFRAIAEFKHRNLVDLHELFFEDGKLFFSMELLTGTNFLNYVRPDDEVDIGRLEHATRQLATGLHALHQAGKLHRDVKPSNIIVTPSGRVVLLDFGLVLERDSAAPVLSAQGAIVGTPAYMSPEQAASMPVGPPSDWYAVGLLLFEALTGSRPHRAKRVAATLHKRMTEDVAPPSCVAPVPPHLDRLTAALLERAPENRPSGEAVLEILGGEEGRTQPALSRASEEFYGRGPELELLEAAFSRCGPDHPVAVFIHGPSGIGKTSLVEAFVRRAAGRATVLRGRCYERESIPFKALDGVVEQLTARIETDETLNNTVEGSEPGGLNVQRMSALQMLFPVLRRLAAPADLRSTPEPVARVDLRETAFDTLKELLRRVGRSRPLVIAIEDLQWCDEDSVPLLRELCRAPGAPPMLLLMTHRDLSETTADVAPDGNERLAPAALREQLTGNDVVEVDLQPLACDEASELAAAIVGDGNDALVQELVSESDGSPMFLIELARSARRANRTRSISLDDALGMRIAALEPGTRAVLTGVALAGGRVDQRTVLEAASRIDPDAAIHRGAVDELRRARLVRTLGVTDRAPIESYHDRVRASVVRRLTPAARRSAHLALAESLAVQQDADPAALATHFAEAGEAQRTVEESLRASRQAMSALAFRRAARWLELARSHLPAGDDRAFSTERRLAEAWSCAGHGAEAAAAYLRASELAPAAQERNSVRRLAAHALVNAGNLESGREMLFSLMRESGIRPPEKRAAAVASLLARRAAIRMRGVSFQQRRAADVLPEQLHKVDLCWAGSFFVNWEPVLGAWFAARHLELALEAGEPSRIAPALASESVSLLALGRLSSDEAWEQLARAEQIAESTGDEEALAWVNFSKPVVSILSGSWSRTIETAQRAIRLLRKQQTGGGVPILSCRYLMCWARYLNGTWRDLEPQLRALSTAGGSSNPRRRACEALLCMPIALAHGEPEVVRTAFDDDELWTSNADGPSPPHALLYTGGIQSRLYAGDPQGAWDYAQRHKTLERRLRFRDRLSRALYFSTRAQAAIARGDSLGLKEAKRAIKKLAPLDVPPAKGLTLLAQAGIAGVRGQADEMSVLLRRALETLQAGEMDMHAAVAQLRLGQATPETQSGQELIGSATAFMRRNGVVDEHRLANAYAPGCASRGDLNSPAL